eukprot:TRINITY_DN44476_c0_g1_i1.p1 TRINITY_DN44476_c0_g1~~TRINITY_DN44476_c0_g1_i1.p1  ORF type:complete len:562 (+),score=124.72 TRINITY_DN44476_c0_g1_i1:58-1743(+)
MPRVRVPVVHYPTVPEQQPSPEFWNDSCLAPDPRPTGGGTWEANGHAGVDQRAEGSWGWRTELVSRESLDSSGRPEAERRAADAQLALLSEHKVTGVRTLLRVLPGRRLPEATVAAAIEALDRDTYRTAANRNALVPTVPAANPPDGEEPAGGNADDAIRTDGLLLRSEVLSFVREMDCWVSPEQWPDPDLAHGIAAVLVRSRLQYRDGVLPKLHYIAAARSFRRRGIGSALIRHFVRGPAVLEVFEHNTLAMALYQKLGFSDIGLAVPQWRLYYRPPPQCPATRASFDELFVGAWPLPDSSVVMSHLADSLPTRRKGTKRPCAKVLRRHVEARMQLPENFFDSAAGHISARDVRRWFRDLLVTVWSAPAPLGRGGARPSAGATPAAAADAAAAPKRGRSEATPKKAVRAASVPRAASVLTPRLVRTPKAVRAASVLTSRALTPRKATQSKPRAAPLTPRGPVNANRARLGYRTPRKRAPSPEPGWPRYPGPAAKRRRDLSPLAGVGVSVREVDHVAALPDKAGTSPADQPAPLTDRPAGTRQPAKPAPKQSPLFSAPGRK